MRLDPAVILAPPLVDHARLDPHHAIIGRHHRPQAAQGEPERPSVEQPRLRPVDVDPSVAPGKDEDSTVGSSGDPTRSHELTRPLPFGAEVPEVPALEVVHPYGGLLFVKDEDLVFGCVYTRNVSEHVGILARCDPNRRLLHQLRRAVPHRPRRVNDAGDIAFTCDGADPGAVRGASVVRPATSRHGYQQENQREPAAFQGPSAPGNTSRYRFTMIVPASSSSTARTMFPLM